MNFIKNPFLFIAIFALVFFIVHESFTYYNGLEKAKIDLYEKDKLILKNLIDAQAENVQILAEVLSSDYEVIEGYLKNDPEIIKKKIFPIWERVKIKKLTHEIHFFKPPAISFVNFSNFKSLGKDVSDVRTDISWITSSFKSSSHALMCKTYAGYRATHPIYGKDGEVLGGLSLGKKIDWIPKALKEKTTHDSFLVYTKDSTESLLPKYYDNFIKDKQIIGNYILADKTINISLQEIDAIDFTKSSQDIKIDGLDYTLYSYPIIDFNKNIMGYICTVTQLEVFKNNFITTLYKNFILIIISVLVITLIARRKIVILFKEIEYIQNITKRIKKRDFTSLHKKNTDCNVSTESLFMLEKDVMKMGLELEKQYTLLEDDNKDKSQQLIQQLYTDKLTGLANRNALLRDLEENKKSYLALFNVRNFKEINDAFGFEAGNYILKELATRYDAVTKKEGYTAYRIGSDEFVITVLEKKSQSNFKEFVHQILLEIEHIKFNIEGQDLAISISMYAGVSYDEGSKLGKAAMALTQAKQDKKELVVYTNKENMKELHLNNIEILNKLSVALNNEGMIVYYQGIVDREEKTHKYEALIRMKDKDKFLSPFLFLELSKRTNYYSRITHFVLESVFEKLQSIDYSISINLTADDILNTDTISLIKEKMQNCKNPQRVVFELVESDDLYSITEMYDFIQYIKKMGAKIAIDDFGTGYSNFSYMMKIEPDYLKIDGSLIKNLDTDENAKKIVETIINFAEQLGIKTIAEYIHSREIFQICKDLGINEFQGYYFSEPGEL